MASPISARLQFLRGRVCYCAPLRICAAARDALWRFNFCLKCHVSNWTRCTICPSIFGYTRLHGCRARIARNHLPQALLFPVAMAAADWRPLVIPSAATPLVHHAQALFVSIRPHCVCAHCVCLHCVCAHCVCPHCACSGGVFGRIRGGIIGRSAGHI